ncbi:MAG TPA: metalloregulator ArsR/SmtB family transcription factor [Phenylobacterium sp.]|jgi:DNA-binding transcriptional ArsR family regulator|nr:metalloregulator ArsR/SmtB family transcription factor [Phenylobacterium sp.]
MDPPIAPEEVYSAIADPTRRRILELLSERPEAVQDLAARFEVSRPAISRHLRVLSEAGLVRVQADGRRNIYALQPEPFETVRQWLDGFWNARLTLLKRLSEGDA